MVIASVTGKERSFLEIMRSVGELMSAVEAGGFIFMPTNWQKPPTRSMVERLELQLTAVLEVLDGPDGRDANIPREATTESNLGSLTDAFMSWGIDFHKTSQSISDARCVWIMVEVIKNLSQSRVLKMS